MSQFKKHKEDALEQLEALKDIYDMDDDSMVDILESDILLMKEQYGILQDELPQALDQEIKWSKDNKESYNISKEYYKGYIKGLEQAKILFDQIKDI